MPNYYAITRRNGQWKSLCSGSNPNDVYRDAVDLIESRFSGGDDYPFVPPGAERELDALRVVNEETAREKYRVTPLLSSIED